MPLISDLHNWMDFNAVDQVTEVRGAQKLIVWMG